MKRLHLVDIILFLMVVFWGANLTIIKVAIKNFHPLAFNCLRFIIATTTMAILYRKVFLDKIDRRVLLRLLILGILGNTVYQLLFIYGVKNTLVTHSAILLGVTPIYIAAISKFTGLEQVTRRAWIGVFLSFTGVVLLVFGGMTKQSGQKAQLLGDLLILLASLVWAIYTSFSKTMLGKYSSRHYTMYTVMFGTFLLVPLSIPSLFKQDWHALGIYEWGALFYSALLALVYGYSAWYYGVEKIGNTRTSAYSNLTPVAGLLFGMLFLGERLSWLQWAGASIVFVGLMLSRFAPRVPEA